MLLAGAGRQRAAADSDPSAQGPARRGGTPCWCDRPGYSAPRASVVRRACGAADGADAARRRDPEDHLHFAAQHAAEHVSWLCLKDGQQPMFLPVGIEASNCHAAMICRSLMVRLSQKIYRFRRETLARRPRYAGRNPDGAQRSDPVTS
ncbi:hypothetical protein SAMN05216516_10299 [Izhakiella capsodis]|uniref:Uncharacterized protein n=1 Tax=Izhakiella capsodis TaxID=1367852 RepID=A0A1I4VUX1_9GAMM|nr:hypothetical protein SAMN05216516_10299 [Izhakiella capsodis]